MADATEVQLLVFLAVSLLLASLGARLLASSRRTGARPERWLGLAFVAAGASVWLIPLAARSEMPPAAAQDAALAAQAGLSLSVALLVRFTWIVFRPVSPTGRALALLLIGANLAGGIALVEARVPVPPGWLGLGVILSRTAAMLWLFGESALYARSMRRRVRLGLADPIVANRFTLWAIWTGALAFIPAFVLTLRTLGLLAPPVSGQPLPEVWRTVFGMLGGGLGVAFVACWLAFYPAPWYRRWIEGRRPA